MGAIANYLSANNYSLARRDALISRLQYEINEVSDWYPPPDMTGVYSATDADALWAVGNLVKQGGNLGAGGTTVRLKGMSLFSLIYVDNPLTLIDNLHGDPMGALINMVRVPIINSDGGGGGWENKSQAQKDTYWNTLIMPVINKITGYGWYVILDYHAVSNWNSAQQVQSIKDFWAYAAPKLKGNPKVIFEMFNEPSDPSVYPFPGSLDNYLQFKTLYQPVVNMIKYYAPYNLLLIGSPSYDTRTQWAQTNAWTGFNLGYTFHAYPQFTTSSSLSAAALQTFLESAIPTNAPVFVTELGYSYPAGAIPGETDIAQGVNYKAGMTNFLTANKNTHPTMWSLGTQGLGIDAAAGADEKAWWTTNLPNFTT